MSRKLGRNVAFWGTGEFGEPLILLDGGSSPPLFVVLACVAGGIDTPTALAKRLTVKPSTVMYHLRRLLDLGFIERGSKEGKWQHYKVNGKVIKLLFLREKSSEMNMFALYESDKLLVEEKDESQEYRPVPLRKFLRTVKNLDDRVVIFVPNMCGGETRITIFKDVDYVA